MNDHSVTSSVLVKLFSWMASVASFAIGLALFFAGQSTTVSAQVGASDGSITEAEDYYSRIASGDSYVTLGAALVAAGVIGIVLTLGLHAKRTARVLVAAESVDDLLGDLADDDVSPEPEIAAPVEVEEVDDLTLTDDTEPGETVEVAVEQDDARA